MHDYAVTQHDDIMHEHTVNIVVGLWFFQEKFGIKNAGVVRFVCHEHIDVVVLVSKSKNVDVVSCSTEHGEQKISSKNRHHYRQTFLEQYRTESEALA